MSSILACYVATFVASIETLTVGYVYLSCFLSGDRLLRRGGSLNKEVEWRPWFSGTQGGSFNKEVEWRQWFGGTQGGVKKK